MAAQDRPKARAGNLLSRAASVFQGGPFKFGKKDSHVPQLGKIYSRAARFKNPHQNPVIVIPGILGSKLVHGPTKESVWGSLKFSQTRPFPGGADTRIALPMRQGVPLNQLHDRVHAESILGQLEVTILGWPIQVTAYQEILGTLGVGGYRADISSSLNAVDYGDDHFSCFEFHYDWRRDCSETAAELDRFIREKSKFVKEQREKHFGPSDEPVRFDIVAHSMGGLVARYYLRYGSAQLPPTQGLPALTWAGAQNVETLILVGTPNSGSVLAFKEMVEGMTFSKAFPKHQAATLGTLPAVYQLLPRPRHQAVIDACNGQRINLYDWKNWRDHNWGLLDPRQDKYLQELLPGTTLAARRNIATDHIQKSLWQAYQFHQALDVPAKAPEGTSIFLIAGDSETTKSQMAVLKGTRGVVLTNESPGDGTVTRASALMDERLSNDRPWTPRLRSPICWAGNYFVFTDHLGLTSSPAFSDNVLYLLLERPR